MASKADAITYYRNDVLTGRVVLITGGASGIGFEVGRQFGLHGAKGVVIMGRREKFLSDAVDLLKKEGVAAAFFAGDVRKPADCAAAVACATATFGSLDVLVASAAGNFLSVAEDLSPNGFKTVMDIDAQGTFNIASAAFSALKDSKFGGNILNISATLHYTATWYQVAPSAAKAAIDAMTRNLAMEWGDYKIRVNGVAPGPIKDTPGYTKLSGGRTDADEHCANSWIPAKRAGTKAEVASACMFLCLNEYITGQTLPVDGGEWFSARGAPAPRQAVQAMSRGAEKKSRDMGPSSKL